MAQRTAAVTGGSRGIGRAVVELLAARGHRVVALARDEEALRRTVAAVERTGGRASHEVLDVTDEQAVTRVFEAIGAVDILVANAGIAHSAAVHRTTLEDWERHLRVNATGVFLCVRAVLPGMQERGWGRVVTVASVAGLTGSRYTAAYTSSKHAAVGFTRVVAAEVAGGGVTANAVCPSYVSTEMTERSVARIAATTGRSEKEARRILEGQTGLGRLIEPVEVAAAVGYLISDEAAAVNGQTIVLDGGGML